MPQNSSVKVHETSGASKSSTDFGAILAAETTDKIPGQPDMLQERGISLNSGYFSDVAGADEENGVGESESVNILLAGIIPFVDKSQRLDGMIANGGRTALSSENGFPVATAGNFGAAAPGIFGAAVMESSRREQTFTTVDSMAEVEIAAGTSPKQALNSISSIISSESVTEALASTIFNGRPVNASPLQRENGILETVSLPTQTDKSSQEMNFGAEWRLLGLVRRSTGSRSTERSTSISSIYTEAVSGERMGRASGPLAAMSEALGLDNGIAVVGGPDSLAAANSQEAGLRGLLSRGFQSEHAGEKLRAGGGEFSDTLSGMGVSLAGGSKVSAVTGPEQSQHLIRGGGVESQIIDQVIGRVTLARTNGETTLGLTLHPKELGEVRIELVSDKDGLRAHLHSQNQVVQDVLEKHLPRLREAFELQGLKIQDLQVSCDARRDNSGGFRHNQGLAQHPANDSGVTASEEIEHGLQVDTPVSGWSNLHGFSLRI